MTCTPSLECVIDRTRWGSVLAVMVIAPWMAEMSWGGIPFTEAVVVVVFLGPMYGGAAVLIREVTRRTGRGWPTVLLLAAAFGILQAGVVDQSLFNPDYARYDFQHPVHVDGIDISLYHLVGFVTGHVVVSISVPLVLAEGWSHRPNDPWLSQRGLGVVAVMYVIATLVNHVGVKEEDGHGFQASPLQVGVALVAVGALLTMALTRSPRRDVRTTGVPPGWALAGLGFAGYLFYLPGENAAALVVATVVIAASCIVLARWSQSTRWSPDHVFWLAVGVALTGVAVPYLAEPYDIGVSAGRELVDDTVAAAVCLVGVGLTVLRRRRTAAAATSGP